MKKRYEQEKRKRKEEETGGENKSILEWENKKRERCEQSKDVTVKRKKFMIAENPA